MTGEIFVLAEHVKGKITDTTYELLTLGRELASKLGRPLKAVLLGKGTAALAQDLGFADGIVAMEHDGLENIGIETWSLALEKILKEKQPEVLLMGSTNPLLGLPSYLSEKMHIPFINLCKSMKVEDNRLIANALLYGGKIEGDVAPKAKPLIVAVRPGNYQGDPAKVKKQVPVEQVPPPPELGTVRLRFKNYIEPDRKDVDITQCDVLVSVGRGIQNKDNVALAEELATLFRNAAVSGSRPVIDQGWLPVTRQVGKSGMTVKPKLYLALGISGAPEHVEGMKNAGLIVAINTDAKAPIFSFAHYGIEGDVFEILPTLIENLKK